MLVKSQPGQRGRARVRAYDTAPGLTSSNHKPVRLLADVSLPPSPPRLLAFDKPRMPKLVLTRVRARGLPRLNIKWHGGIGGAKPDAYLKVRASASTRARAVCLSYSSLGTRALPRSL